MISALALSLLAAQAAPSAVRAGPIVVPREVPAASQGVSRAVLAEYSRCIVRRKHDAAARAVLGDGPIGRDEGLNISDCMPDRSRMRATAVQMRYGFADALVAADIKAPPADLAAVAPLAHRPFVDRPMPAVVAADPARVERWNAFAQAATAYATLSPLGECVVRANPGAALRLLRTPVESDEEKNAIGGLGTALTGCVATGAPLSVNRFALRGTIALNFYRLAMAPRVTAAGAN